MATTTTDAAGSDPIQVWQSNGAGTEKARITSAGKIGIGTASPVTLVDIISNGATMGGVADSGLHIGNEGSANDRAQIALGYPGIYVPGVIGFVTVVDSGHTYGDMYFGTRSTTDDAAPTERMRIMSSGKIGIGTTSPARTLDVNGFAKFKTPAVSATKSSTQSIPNTGWTVVNFDTESFDNDNLHDNTTNNSRLTASEAGIWMITANVQWAGSSAGNWRLHKIRLNGSSDIAQHASPPLLDNTTLFATGFSLIAQLAANDYVELLVNQFTSGSLNLDPANGGIQFQMYKVSD